MAESLKKKFLLGTSWTTSEHILLTIIGVLQLSITSRLLTPVDFGIYAIACFFAGLGRIAFSMGLGASLIQKKGNIDKYLNTTWAASILIAIIITILIMVVIPVICTAYYHNSEAIWPSLVIMLNCILTAAANPGIIVFQKEIELKKVFILNVSSKFFSFILVLICVFVLKTYWGLIIALLFESVFRLYISFRIHPFRPKFDINWSYFKELYSFSGWIQLKNVANWFSGSLDTAIVGNILGTGNLGFYNRAQSVSQYAPSFINAVVDTVAFPLYSQINENQERFNRVLISIQNLMICLMSLVAIVFILYSEELIDLVLGSQWISMADVFCILAISYLFQALLLSFTPVLRAYGFSRQEFIFYIIKISITVALLYPFIYRWDLIGAAWAIASSVAIAFPIMIMIIKKKTKLHLRKFYISVIIAITSVVVTYFVLNYILYFIYDLWWILGLFLALCVISGIELLFYFLFRTGPGETVFNAIHLFFQLK